MGLGLEGLATRISQRVTGWGVGSVGLARRLREAKWAHWFNRAGFGTTELLVQASIYLCRSDHLAQLTGMSLSDGNHPLVLGLYLNVAGTEWSLSGWQRSRKWRVEDVGALSDVDPEDWRTVLEVLIDHEEAQAKGMGSEPVWSNESPFEAAGVEPTEGSEVDDGA
jgi:hypothetical protein